MPTQSEMLEDFFDEVQVITTPFSKGLTLSQVEVKELNGRPPPYAKYGVVSMQQMMLKNFTEMRGRLRFNAQSLVVYAMADDTIGHMTALVQQTRSTGAASKAPRHVGSGMPPMGGGRGMGGGGRGGGTASRFGGYRPMPTFTPAPFMPQMSYRPQPQQQMPFTNARTFGQSFKFVRLPCNLQLLSAPTSRPPTSFGATNRPFAQSTNFGNRPTSIAPLNRVIAKPVAAAPARPTASTSTTKQTYVFGQPINQSASVAKPPPIAQPPPVIAAPIVQRPTTSATIAQPPPPSFAQSVNNFSGGFGTMTKMADVVASHSNMSIARPPTFEHSAPFAQSLNMPRQHTVAQPPIGLIAQHPTPTLAQQPMSIAQQPPSLATSHVIRTATVEEEEPDVTLAYGDQGNDANESELRLLIVRPDFDTIVPPALLSVFSAEQRDCLLDVLDYLKVYVYQPVYADGLQMDAVYREWELESFGISRDQFLEAAQGNAFLKTVTAKHDGLTMLTCSSTAVGFSTDKRLQPYDRLLDDDQPCLGVTHFDHDLVTEWRKLVAATMIARRQDRKILCDSYFVTVMPQSFPIPLGGQYASLRDKMADVHCEDGSRFVKVHLMTCKSIDRIYVIWHDTWEQFDLLQNAMREFYGERCAESLAYGVTSTGMKKLFPQMVVAAPYTTGEGEGGQKNACGEAVDRTVEYCRAIVTKYAEGDDLCTIAFVDHGGPAEEASVSELRLLPIAFTRLPTQSATCALGNLSVVDDSQLDVIVEKILEMSSAANYSVDNEKDGLYIYLQRTERGTNSWDADDEVFVGSLLLSTSGRHVYIDEQLVQMGLCARGASTSPAVARSVDEVFAPVVTSSHVTIAQPPTSSTVGANQRTTFTAIPDHTMREYRAKLTQLLQYGDQALAHGKIVNIYRQCLTIRATAESDAESVKIGEQMTVRCPSITLGYCTQLIETVCKEHNCNIREMLAR